MRKQRFTLEELSRYNGKNGAPIFVACQGKVYDVSRSFLWQSGTHQVLHTAGADLTRSLDQAPHDVDVLARFPIVGMLDGS